jgi:thiol-disulfide isomerase/thioredoxin/YHS domain-containing protein
MPLRGGDASINRDESSEFRPFNLIFIKPEVRQTMWFVKRYFASVCCLLTLATVTAGQAEEVRWRKDLETAKREAADTGKLVLVHFWADWCGPCLQFERTVLNQGEAAKAIEAKYVPVKLHADQFPSMARAFAIRSLPTDIVISSTGVEIARFATPAERRRIATAQSFASEITKLAAVHQPRTEAAIASKPAPATTAAPGKTPATAVANVPPATNPYAAIGQVAKPPATGAANVTTTPNQPVDAAAKPNTAGFPVMPSGPRPAASRYSSGPSAGRPIANTTAPQVTPSASGLTATTGPAAAMAGRRHAAGLPQTTPGLRSPATPVQPMLNPRPTASTTQTPSGVNPPSKNTSRYSSASPPPAAAVVSGPPAALSQAAPQTRPTPKEPSGPVAQPKLERNLPDQASTKGHPPLGLDGYCPVSLQSEERWIVGDRRWGVIHEGRTYLFMGPTHQQRFLADPAKYSPVLSGTDAVLAMESKQAVPGDRRYGVVFDSRVFLFSSEKTLQRFSQDPERFANGVRQARQMSHNQTTPR